MASDIKDIKNSQSQLTTDVAYCRTLLQQHSDSTRHEDQILNYEASIQNLHTTPAALSSSIADIESRITTRLTNLDTTHITAPTNDTSSTYTETLEIPRRSHNILLRDVTESNNDSNIVTEIFNHIEPYANDHHLSVTRLGTPTSRPRLRRVTFTSQVFARIILQKKNSIISHPSFNYVKILDDKTPTQMLQPRELRDELKRRQTTGELNSTIKYVRGTPSIVPLPAQESTTSKN
nr:unnamed protein product [Callosobruchus chinensis]